MNVTTSTTVIKEGKEKNKHTCFIDEALRLLLHPLLIVVLHIFFVLSAAAVRLPHRRLQQKQKGTIGIFSQNT